MPASEKELEEQLLEAGNRLLSFPSSVDDLLPLLDRIEVCLSRVEQSPPESLQTALAPSMKALVADVHLRHADEDVRVAVAACISEITRITAPEAPYDDDRMKEVFKLIVSSFEKLHDKSSRSYSKRASILETVAKVRSCVLMLDLECDELILEMFNHFFKTVRDNHPENIVSSMETIMVLVLEESEEISPELINSILSRLEIDNQEVLPVARTLGERVLENCAPKLKPLLVQTMELLRKSLFNYGKVVASICEQTPGDELNNVHAVSKNSAEDNDLSKTSGEAEDVYERTPLETVHSEVPVAVVSSPKAIASNGSIEKEVNDSSAAATKDSSHVAENDGQNEHQTKMEINQIQTVGEDKTGSTAKSQSKSKSVKTGKKRGRPPKFLTSPPDPSESHVDSDKEEKLSDHDVDKNNNSASSDHDASAANTAKPFENEKESDIPVSANIVSGDHDLDGPSPSPSRTVPQQSQPRKVGRPRKIVESVPKSPVDLSPKEVEGASVPEVETDKQTDPKMQIANETSPSPPEGSNKEGTSNKLDAKPVEQTVKKDEDVASPVEETKKRKRGRPPKDSSETPPTNIGKKPVSPPKISSKLNKEGSDLGKTDTMNSKRKRTPVRQKVGDPLADNLIGSRIKVWWPDDEAFYEGVVSEFYSAEKKHKVTYDDGDIEILALKDEKWEFVDDRIVSLKAHVTEGQRPDASSEMHKDKKAKPNHESAAKRGRPSKAKATPSSSGLKQKDEDKLDVKSKDASSADEKGGKSKDPKGSNRSVDNVSISSLKTKDYTKLDNNDDHMDMAKSSSKSGLETPKEATDTKGKRGRKPKGGSSKGKEENVPTESAKGPESGKGKSPSSSKGKEEDVKKLVESAAVSECGKGKSPSSAKGKEEDVKTPSGESAKASEPGKGKSPSSSKGKKSGTKSTKKRPRGS